MIAVAAAAVVLEFRVGFVLNSRPRPQYRARAIRNDTVYVVELAVGRRDRDLKIC